MTEVEMIKEAQQNPERFEVVYNTYYEQVLRFVYRRMANIDDAYDITSQVFTKAFTNIKKFEFKNVPFSCWLFRIAVSEVGQFYRNAAKLQTVSIDKKGIKNIAEETNNEIIALEKQLMTAIHQLEAEEVQLIEFRFFDSLSFAEIATILSITENNAKVKTYRVLDKLRIIFKKTND